MKKLSLLINIFILLFIANTTNAQEEPIEDNKRPDFPQGFIYGAGVAYNQQIYKGFEQRSIALPLLGYVGKKLNVFGPFVSYSLVKNDNWNFDLNISPRFNGFDEGDSEFFTGLEKRKDSLDAGFTAKYKHNQWSYQFKALADVLSNSNGSDVEFNIARKFKYHYLTIEPALSINSFDKNLTDYYYGVQEDETNEFRSFYEGSASINKSFKLSLSHPIPIGLIRLDVDNTWFGSGISDSPLVDSDKAFGARLFFIGFF